MEIDRSFLEKIGEMNDEEISKAVMSVASTLGINPKLAKKIAAEPSFVRKKVKHADSRDIRKITEAIGEKELADVIKMLGLEGDRNGSK